MSNLVESSVSMKPLELLLVEDSPGDVLLIRQSLARESRKTNIRVALDGVQAMEILSIEGFKPDLVILDLNLPKVSGFYFLERCPPKIPVVAFTSSPNPQDRQRAIELGARDYVCKPMDFDEYCRAVRQMVRKWTTSDTRPILRRLRGKKSSA